MFLLSLSLWFAFLFISSSNTAVLTRISESSDDESEVLLDNNLNLIYADRADDLRRVALKSVKRCEKGNLFVLREMNYDFFGSGVWSKAVKGDWVCGVMYLLKHYLRKKADRRRALGDSIKYGANWIFYYTLQMYGPRVKSESKKKQARIVQLAGKKKRYWMLEQLAAAGFNANNANSLKQGRTILHEAVIAGDLELVRSLLNFEDLDVNGLDSKGNSPLHYAADMEIFVELMGVGGDPLLKNKMGVNALFAAQPSFTARNKLFEIYFDSGELEFEDFGSIMTRFISTEQDTSINPSLVSSRNNNYVEVYRRIGADLAKALIMRAPINVKLAPSLVKFLYGEEMEDDDPAVCIEDATFKVKFDQMEQMKLGFDSIIPEIRAFFTLTEFQKLLIGSVEIC